MIEVRELTKRYGDRVAVDDLSFAVRPGSVTGFLGPNGSGKSTTMRVILGLDRPDRGVALVNGIPYREHVAPARSVGALLDASEIHPARTAEAHLLSLAVTTGAGRARVSHMLETVGLSEVARRRVGTFSLGMRQRLGIATALLGDPEVVILDEPINGLDPDGVVWARQLMRSLANEGRTVFVSSHLMSEMAQTADQLVVVGRGRLLADVPTQELLASDTSRVIVRSARAVDLAPILGTAGAYVDERNGEQLTLRGMDSHDVARLALQHRILVHELRTQTTSLEEAFMSLTHGEREYAGTDPTVDQGVTS